MSAIGPTSFGEIYNLHAAIVDRNDEKHAQRTCQELAKKLAEMFAFASELFSESINPEICLFSSVDSGKTGYVIKSEDIQPIRDKYGQEYPDFLMKHNKPSYPSQSIVGKLYRNAVNYKHPSVEPLNKPLAQLSISQPT